MNEAEKLVRDRPKHAIAVVRASLRAKPKRTLFEIVKESLKMGLVDRQTFKKIKTAYESNPEEIEVKNGKRSS